MNGHRAPRVIGSVIALWRNTIYACVLAWAAVACGYASEVQPAWTLPPGVRTLSVNGYPMAYIEKGAGPTVVFVHGILNDYRYWTPQLDSLAGRYRVVSVSLRHYYPEKWHGTGEDFSIRVHAEDVATFIERLGVGPVYLVGHSRGGSVAAGTAKLHPRLVQKLVLAEPSLFPLIPQALIPEGRLARPHPADVRRALDMLNRGEVEAGLEYYLDVTNGSGMWRSYSAREKQIVRDNAWTIISGVQHVDIVSCDDLRDMPMPILLVQGEKGPGFLRAIIDSALKCAPTARRIVIPHAGHRMNWQNSRAFDSAIVQFFSNRQRMAK